MIISLISPEKVVFAGEVEMAIIPGSEGDFGVLDLHAPFMTTLRKGTVSFYNKGVIERAYTLTGGFAEVTPEKCIILADSVGE
jgi:F-type H+-transporting ATPase subunit epsilon